MRIKDTFKICPKCVERKEVTIDQLYLMMTTAIRPINPNPIGQRPPTIEGYQNAKNVGIIVSILMGFGIDTIYLRDITGYDADDPAVKDYGNDGYLTIDGGHRLRAVRWFMQNKFYVPIEDKKVYFRDLQNANEVRDPELMGIAEKFLNSTVALKYIVCTSAEAHEWFLMINNMTKTNEIESIMADEESAVARYIRMNTWYVKEYANEDAIHPIFRVGVSKESEYETAIWSKPNTGGSFYLFAFVALAKALGKGNVDAGEKQWKKMIADNYVGIDNLNKTVTDTWNKFFDDLMAYQKVINRKIDYDVYGAFSCVWFSLFSKYGKNFKFNMHVFAPLLASAQYKLTVKNGSVYHNEYDDVYVTGVDGDKDELKRFIRKYITSRSEGKKQEFAAKYLLEEIERLSDDDTGITIMDTKRSLSRKDRELMFAGQMGKCWMDFKGYPCESVKAGKAVTVDTCDLAHDLAHSKGGKAEDGVMMCRDCHKDMATMTLDEFVKVKTVIAA